MVRLLDIVTILCIGLLIGTEFAVSAFVNPVLYRLDTAAQASAIRMFARRLGKAMPFWYVASLLLLIAGAIAHHRSAGETLLLAAGAIWIAVIVHTLLVLVPINNRMMQLSPEEFPAEARREHRKWDNLHRLRVAALAVAMVCFLVAVRV